MRKALAMAAVLLACGTAAAADDVDVVQPSVAKPRGVPRVHVEPVRVGDPPVALIRRVVHREIWSVLGVCYRSGLRRNAKLAGRVDVELTLEASGVVEAARAASTTVRNANFVQCIVHAFATVVFPRLRARTIVRYPIELRQPPSGTT